MTLKVREQKFPPPVMTFNYQENKHFELQILNKTFFNTNTFSLKSHDFYIRCYPHKNKHQQALK